MKIHDWAYLVNAFGKDHATDNLLQVSNRVSLKSTAEVMKLLPPALILFLNLLPLLPGVGIPKGPLQFPLQRTPRDLENFVALIFDPRLDSGLYGLHSVHLKALIGSSGEEEELVNVLTMEEFAEILRGGRRRLEKDGVRSKKNMLLPSFVVCFFYCQLLRTTNNRRKCEHLFWFVLLLENVTYNNSSTLI